MMKIQPEAVYLGDNGCAYCGEHLGMTGRTTGRDLSGQALYKMTPEDARQHPEIRCEVPSCGKKPSTLHLP